MKTFVTFLFVLLSICHVLAQTNTPPFIATEREWHDDKGNALIAAWKCVSRNGKTILLQAPDSLKPINVPVKNLSTNDQAFVRSFLADCRRRHLVWDSGIYISQEEHLKRMEQKVIELEKQHELRKRYEAATSRTTLDNARMVDAHKAAMERKLAHIRAHPNIYSPTERRLAQVGNEASENPFALPVAHQKIDEQVSPAFAHPPAADGRYPSMITAQSSRNKKWNVSKEDWLILQEANRNFPHDREEYLRQHPYDTNFNNYEPPRISFGEDGHLNYDSNY